jgi:uncharacterized protein (DUF1810 family)
MERQAMKTSAVDDPYNLQRFVDAQEAVYSEVCAELRAGRKRSHWMWFIFPQIRGLGHSSMAAFYAISSLEEAKAYLNHPILGPRLLECCRLVNQIEGRRIEDIFGFPDYLKFRSSITLFGQASSDSAFTASLEKYFQCEPDAATLDRLQAS